MIDIIDVEVQLHLDSQIHVFSLFALFYSDKRIKGSSAGQLLVNCPWGATSNSLV
jgi:hypothetical protein